jgi:hypothetical protein
VRAHVCHGRERAGTCAPAAMWGARAASARAAPQVLHRAGLQFFEVASYAVTTGLVALVVFRSLLQRPFGTVWDFPAEFPEVDSRHVLVGAPPGGGLD